MADDLSHVDGDRAVMVNVGGKPVTARSATASARVVLNERALAAVRSDTGPKGPVLETVRLAGLMSAKRTADLIPLCHPLPLDHVSVDVRVDEAAVRLESTVRCHARTGVEMEALTVVSVAALTLVDMTKALGHDARITDIQVERKSGGRSGDYARGESAD